MLLLIDGNVRARFIHIFIEVNSTVMMQSYLYSISNVFFFSEIPEQDEDNSLWRLRPSLALHTNGLMAHSS